MVRAPLNTPLRWGVFLRKVVEKAYDYLDLRNHKVRQSRARPRALQEAGIGKGRFVNRSEVVPNLQENLGRYCRGVLGNEVFDLLHAVFVSNNNEQEK